MSNRTVLVTGGAGFIGSHVADALQVAGFSVVILDDMSSGSEANIPSGAVLQQVDIRDRDKVRGVFEKVRPMAVFHLAAQASVVVSTQDPVSDVQTNVLGTVHLLEAAARTGCQHFLFSSTGGAIYSPTASLPCTEDSSVDPLSVYGLSKAAAETYIRYFSRVNSISATILRLSNVYGPRQNSQGEAGVVAIFGDRILHGGEIVLDGDGKQTRDFIYVTDVAEAFLTCLKEDVPGTYNVSTQIETSVNQLYRSLIDAAGVVPAPTYGPARPNDMRRSMLSSSLLQSKSTWRPSVPLDEGVIRTVAWFKQK